MAAAIKKKRLSFVIIGEYPIVQADPRDNRSCKEWMQKALNMDEDMYSFVIRGYMTEGLIQFYTGGDRYSPADGVTETIVRNTIERYHSVFPTSTGNPRIGNGVHPGRPDEYWPPVLEWIGHWALGKRSTYEVK